MGAQGKIWKCSGDDRRDMPENIWKRDFSILSDPQEMMKAVREWKVSEHREEVVLPLVQNLEGVVLGAGIVKRGNLWATGDYPFSKLEQIEETEFNILSDDRVQALLEAIRTSQDEKIILEMEAPFTVLSALVNPVKLYRYTRKNPELLVQILEKISQEEIKYLDAVIDAGCKIISLADPAGTVDLVGEPFFEKFSGNAVRYLLEQSKPLLDHSLIHLCGKLSSSMLALDMEIEHDYSVTSDDYLDNLLEAASDSEVRFAGHRCIHMKKNPARKIHVIDL